MSVADTRLVLRKGREKAARQRHPWVFSGSVERVEGEIAPGAVADLVDGDGEFVARGFYNPRSQILFRALTWRREEVDAGFLRARISGAAALRRQLLPAGSDAYRVVHGEGDQLPGLVVDRYGEHLVLQIGALGMEVLRETIVEALVAELGPRGIWERSDGPARREEGLEARNGLAWGEEPPEHIDVGEEGVRYAVDVRAGQKTGFYLDQREGRAMVRRLARGRRVLDLFSYSGAFAVQARAGGALAVTAVDSSERSLALLPRHLELNGLASDAVETRVEDAFQFLRKGEKTWDLIVVDPPPFAKKKSEVDGAARGYKDLNLHALRRLAPGGVLLTSSCSHHVSARLFQQILFGAVRDAGRPVQLLSRLGHPWDHPVSMHHPEGEYLKSLLLRV